MILAELVHLYKRRKDKLTPFGFQEEEISFVIELTPEGIPVTVHNLREKTNNREHGERFFVPAGPTGRTGTNAHLKSNLLWERGDYLFFIPAEDEPEEKARKRQKKVREARAAFLDRLGRLVESCGADEGVLAVQRFLGDRPEERIQPFLSQDDKDLLSGKKNKSIYVTFRLTGDAGFVFERPNVRAKVPENVAAFEGDRPEGRCLVTGETAPIARLHPPVKGVAGARSTGANIVSFNKDAFESHGLEQGMNAPVGEYAAFAYTTALNALLAPGSRSRVHAGAITIVFWAGEETPNEDVLAEMFGIAAGDDETAGTESLRALLSAPRTGRLPIFDDRTRFFVLGLSAESGSRLTVRFFHQATVGEEARALQRYFSELEIAGADRPPTLSRLLRALAVMGKIEHVPNLLAADFLRAVFAGTPFPERLLAQALARCAAESGPTPDRARLIKAFLIRNRRKEFPVSLDKDNPDPAYRLGRLFAELESLQRAALNPKATIRDRFFGAASTTPGYVFPELERLAMSHIGKLQGEKPGRARYFEASLAEIHSGLPAAFPARLSLNEQGAFVVGYWHQQAFNRTSPADRAGVAGKDDASSDDISEA